MLTGIEPRFSTDKLLSFLLVNYDLKADKERYYGKIFFKFLS